MKRSFYSLSLFIGFLVVALLAGHDTYAQGCVAIRNLSCSGSASCTGSTLLGQGQWQASLSYRYFRSFRHFRGDEEEPERVEHNTEVVNLSHVADFGLSYAFSNRFSVTATIPFIYYDRSSLYEHYGNSTNSNPDQKRFHTYASGIGDMRISGTYWLLDPEKHHKSNVAVGLGVKIPTGNEGVIGDFHKLDENGNDYIIQKPVDQSIQLGDGGWGVNLEVQAYQQIFNRGSLYLNGFYLFNPQTENDVARTGTVDGVDPLIAYFSIPDQFAARLGLNYVIVPSKNIAISLGGRVEGVPAKDAIGSSNGYRRPGYVVSADPGLTYSHGRASLAINVPVALYRNRVKSVFDLAYDRHGDAAFADYLINVGFAYQFGRSHASMEEMPKWEDLNN